MQRRTSILVSVVGAIALSTLGISAPAAADPDHQHGGDEGHLSGSGAWGNIDLLDVVDLTDTPDLIADVTVSPDGDTAYLANWGEPDCAGPETGGMNSPDAGAYIVDISDIETDPESAELIGFIPSHQDTRPGEGMQVVEITTASFSGDILVMNNEACGKNGKGGVTLYDVSDPSDPKKLSANFGDRSPGDRDTHQIHSAFAWDAGDRAYVVLVDNEEFPDVDILDITNPRRPVLVAEYDLNDFDVAQPELGLDESFLHDVVVKQIDGASIMLLSYWDGGYVLLDVTDPANADFLGDTEFADVDPELLESLGVSLTPEGNAHQAEFTLDDAFFIGTDEDFAPHRTDALEITSGAFQGEYPSVIVPGGQPPAYLDDLTLSGPVVYGGYGCPTSAPVPSPEDVPGYLDLLQPGDEQILVLQRGPTGDPSAPEGACFPGEKAHEAALVGWDAVLFVQRHVTPDDAFCGSGAFVDPIVAVCTTHDAFHKLFNEPPFDPAQWTYPEDIAIGQIGERIQVGSVFDGWGYVHLFDRMSLEELDTYAIDEAHDPDYAFGFGDLSVHEVATDPQDASLAYLSYYSGGLRSIQIMCGGAPYDPANPPADTGDCQLVEVGGYLDEAGNDFWGVQAFIGEDGRTYILGSDRDSGLWIFTVTE
ncbi:LVIVD repeat-containing protein [Agromyces bauzanensis]|uniref:LVIVD repeat-containing protein n=1 Tax=Agromyces bauzanensis TaxID=1308924 RepID=A0A917PMY7_9MICO|nr:hypothetical protein [Agromyces bauzanensis]GGJ85579.1 hypothetical protein GCM10011372_24860 [Agromyces bauzanensis]